MTVSSSADWSPQQGGVTIFDRAKALRLLTSLPTGAPTPQLVTRVTATLHDGTEVTTKWQPVRVAAGSLPARRGGHR